MLAPKCGGGLWELCENSEESRSYPLWKEFLRFCAETLRKFCGRSNWATICGIMRKFPGDRAECKILNESIP